MLNIISITKDDPDGISRTIESTRILREKFDIRQIIIDSSSDKIKQKVNSIAINEKNITYLWQEPNGISQAFNKGIEVSEDGWLWFLNGGDEVYNELDISHFIYILSKTTAEAIIFQIKFMESGLISKHPPMWYKWPPLFNWIPHPATIIDKNLFKKYGFFSNKFKIAMDGEIWIRFFSNEIIVDTISFPIASFDETGISSTNKNLLSKEIIKIIKIHYFILIKRWLGNGIRLIKAWKEFSLLSYKK